jgi:hypothetical protein
VRGFKPYADKVKTMQDATKYASTSFIKLEDVESGSITAMIVAVEEDTRYDKLNLILDSGRKFSCNKTNTTKLIRAFGKDWSRNRAAAFYRLPASKSITSPACGLDVSICT